MFIWVLKHLGRKTGNIYFDAIVIECLHEIIWALYIFIVMMIMMMTEMILFFGILREFSKWNSVYSQHLIEMWTEETLCGCTCFEVIFRHLSNICEKKSKYENKMQTKTMCDFAFLSLRLQSACLLSRFNRVTWAQTHEWKPYRKNLRYFLVWTEILRPEISMNSSRIIWVNILIW